MSPEFLITTFVIVASPGTGVIYTLAAGLSRGARASLLAAFACTLGIVPHLVAALAGIAAVLHASALLFNAVKYAGVAYLLYMAWMSLKEHGALKVEKAEDRRSAGRIIVDGIVVNLLNPKLSIFFVSFLPQFIAADDTSPLLSMLELSGVFMAGTFIVFAIYGIFAAAMRDHIITKPAVVMWMRRAFAAAFGGLAIKLALTERT
jgi:threonine/homoserine/homoserine lactone efflux protein